jgi:hypothetical protein
MNIQSLLRNLPAQMQRHHQQPVFLIDAVGRYSPFFFWSSSVSKKYDPNPNLIRLPRKLTSKSQAFTGVLRTNFVNFGQAMLKIDRHEFAIQVAHTKWDIDLDGDWKRCF